MCQASLAMAALKRRLCTVGCGLLAWDHHTLVQAVACAVRCCLGLERAVLVHCTWWMCPGGECNGTGTCTEWWIIVGPLEPAWAPGSVPFGQRSMMTEHNRLRLCIAGRAW